MINFSDLQYFSHKNYFTFLVFACQMARLQLKYGYAKNFGWGNSQGSWEES